MHIALYMLESIYQLVSATEGLKYADTIWLCTSTIKFIASTDSLQYGGISRSSPCGHSRYKI